ncbi:short subunit dehydrogenase [Saccharopolyspora spinosa]|uniref:Short subunit dehydrogenase n=1 Tax=Saccharopolyspora spinosa TaxID=60894 RepID=A0A2N3XPN4_SACSN|nr:short subunit dehydrogenase [Saccharopolyspora spinosa]
MSEFAGRAAVATGGGSGIGLAVVTELAVRGAAVAALDLDPSGVPADVLGLRCDVVDEESVSAAVEQVPPAHRAARVGGRSRRGRRLPGRSGGRVHHRHGARGGRRDPGPAPAEELKGT